MKFNELVKNKFPTHSMSTPANKVAMEICDNMAKHAVYISTILATYKGVSSFEEKQIEVFVNIICGSNDRALCNRIHSKCKEAISNFDNSSAGTSESRTRKTTRARLNLSTTAFNKHIQAGKEALAKEMGESKTVCVREHYPIYLTAMIEHLIVRLLERAVIKAGSPQHGAKRRLVSDVNVIEAAREHALLSLYCP